MTRASTSPDAGAAAEGGIVELAVTGMTCAACAARIERRLNRLDGVTASVNYATERARVIVAPDAVGVAVDDVIATILDTGYGATLPDVDVETAAAERYRDLLRRLWVSIVLGVPVLVLSMVPPLQFDGWQWVALVLATPVATWSAWPFHRAMALNLRHRQATMDTLVSVGVIAALGWSIWALLATPAGHIGMEMSMSLDVSADAGHHIYLEVASTVVAFILAGRAFEARAKRRAGDALRSLLDLGAKEVTRRRPDGTTELIAIDALAVGDEFIVRPGEQVATDGIVIEGASAVDLSLLTGESVPVEVGVGSSVIGAAVNSVGVLVVRATGVGSDTQLARMARLVTEAQSGKAPVQRLADRISAVFVPIVIGLSLVTVVAWLLIDGSVERAFGAGVAVLIIACPCALGLATPTALLVGTGRGAQMGIVIKGPEILESTRRVDTLVLDKTGTVTTGRMSVRSVHPEAEAVEAEVLGLAAAVERDSSHPIAVAIVEAARQIPMDRPVVATDVVDSPGIGISGTVEGRRVEVVRAVLGDDDLDPAATMVDVVVDGRRVGRIAVADTPKTSSAAAVRAARELGLEPVLLTGDRRSVAQSVAASVGIEIIHAEVMPADKLAVVNDLQSRGRVVAMVGDGVNDAAALAAADLGIAMGTGTDVAMNASDLTLVRSELTAVVDAIRLSRRTLRVITVNLFWAFAYNVAAIPLAMSGRLSPVIAGAAMAFSSVFVVSNSLRLRRFR